MLLVGLQIVSLPHPILFTGLLYLDIFSCMYVCMYVFLSVCVCVCVFVQKAFFSTSIFVLGGMLATYEARIWMILGQQIMKFVGYKHDIYTVIVGELKEEINRKLDLWR